MSRKLHLLETKMCSQGPQVGHPRSEAEVTQRYSARFAPLSAVPRDSRILLAGLGIWTLPGPSLTIAGALRWHSGPEYQGDTSHALHKPSDACAWRIHKITRQSASGTARDSASASDRRASLSAT